MKKKNQKIIIGCVLFCVIGAIFLFLFFQNKTKLTSEEKLWISENATTVQNISILNDTNLFGKLGEGVFYEFLKDFSQNYNLKINPITMNKTDKISGISFTVADNLSPNSFALYIDHYVLVGKAKETISEYQKILEKKIGVLEESADYAKANLENTSITSYSSDAELFQALEQGDVDYLLIPRMEYIDQILKKNLTIAFHLSELKRYFCVSTSEDSLLYQILKKYSAEWLKKNLEEKINTYELKLFKENLNISDTALASLQNESITYGYRVHEPYEVYADHSFGGIFSELLNSFSHFAKVEMKFNKYQNEKKMIKDFNNNKITLYANYDTTMNNGAIIDTYIPLSFDIYAHETNHVHLYSMESLKGKTIYVEKNSLLYQNLSTIKDLQLETYEPKKINDILKKDRYIAVDHQTGLFLADSTLKEFVSRYHGYFNTTYQIRSLGSETLNTLLAKYLNYIDTNTFVNQGYYSALKTTARGNFMNSVAHYVLCATAVILIILFLIYRSNKKVKMQKKVKKEDRLKYIDQLTSLKNRNYLNENLSHWNKNTIYPQAVIVIDLDKIQEINDTLGYEEGDRQIRSAANSLIKTQLDNTDIIRTDGNEFLIYLIGYNQKQITSYLNKLKREFKNLPFEYGVTVSYSMILDDLKSIEDALNECVLDIKKQKEEKKEEEK